MATYTLSPNPKFTGWDNSGLFMPLGKLYTYVTGTTTPADTYKTANGTLQSNPIILDGAGRVPGDGLFLVPGQIYSFELRDSAGNVIWNEPGIAAVPLSTSNQDVTGTAGEDLAAGDQAYLSDGSGSKQAGQWYKTDADFTYASTLPVVGTVVSAIANGAAGTFRLAGQVTLTGPLTPGANYYLSATAGALTASAPTNARFVGRAETTTSLIVAANPPSISTNATPLNICEGRLTATTGVPVTSGDVSGATSIFFAPYKGNRIALYDGASSWNVRTFTEITISLSGLTASKPYDVFAYDNAGVVTIETLVWTSATARATALTTQDGVLVKTGATTRRYLGTVYINASGAQTDDTVAKRYLWNYYNRVRRPMRVLEATNSWTYNGVIRQANASTANQLDVVVGWAEVLLEAEIHASYIQDTSAGVDHLVGIGEDSTTTVLTSVTGRFDHNPLTTGQNQITCELRYQPAVGRHFYAWLEYSSAATTTWLGDNGALLTQSGIYGSIEG